jgi:hypothetical protein
MRKQFTFLLILFFVFGLVPINFSSAADLANRLKGKILLQVEDKGQAWYVEPKTGERHYMANGDEAYNIMRNLGVGISNKDLEKIQKNKNSAVKHSGKIFLQVESKGEAYYVDFSGNLHYLKNGSEAYSTMRNLGLGITNKDLEKIPNKLSAKIETSDLKKLTNSEIIKKIKPAVVYIETSEGVGSGMIIESNGYILTNAHVVADVNSAKIYLYNGISKTASVVGKDENLDVALLKIDSNNYSKVDLGDSDKVEQGDDVFTLGFPFGIKGDVSFKEGTISRRIESYFETSAEIHPGNSGGPLVNRYGQVIGVNTAIFGKSISGVQLGETIKLAIPINNAKNLIPDLKAGKIFINEEAKAKEAEEKKKTEEAKKETERIAAEARAKETEEKRRIEEENKRIEAENLVAQQRIQKKQEVLTEYNTKKLNLEQQIADRKAKYYADYAALTGSFKGRGVTASGVQWQYDALLREANKEIDLLNIELEKLRIEYLNKLNQL